MARSYSSGRRWRRHRASMVSIAMVQLVTMTVSSVNSDIGGMRKFTYVLIGANGSVAVTASVVSDA